MQIKSKANLLLVLPWWFPDQGGVVTAVDNLSKMLNKQGYNITVLIPSSSKKAEVSFTEDGIELHKIYLRHPVIKNHLTKSVVAFFLFLPSTLIKIWKLLERKQIGIINIHYPIGYDIYFVIIKAILGKKLIVSIWGADVTALQNESKANIYILSKILRSANVIIACSRMFLSEAINKFPGIEYKSSVIYPGVNIDRFSSQPLVEQSFYTDQRYLLSVANLEKWKGIDTLILAFKLVADKVNDITLFIAGDGPERDKLETLIAKLGLSSRVFLLGKVDQYDIIPLFQNCHFFVLPSRIEPFGIVFLEAFACKKSVIATNIGGIPEFVKNDVNGLLVEPDDAQQLGEKIMELLLNQDLRQTLGQNGYLMVKNRFSWDTAIENYELVIHRLI